YVILNRCPYTTASSWRCPTPVRQPMPGPMPRVLPRSAMPSQRYPNHILTSHPMNRRTFLFTGVAALAASRRAKIAAVITAYYRNSHADVFIGNMLRGYYWEGKPHESELEIAAMHLAQTPSNDIGRAEAAGHGIPIKATVSEAIVPGIQGVALIGEHGD